MLFIATCYNSNQKTTMLAFSVVRTEDAASLAWFLKLLLSTIQGILTIMYDGAKGIVNIEVKMMLQSLQITQLKCAWHRISNKMKNSTLCTTQAESGCVL